MEELSAAAPAAAAGSSLRGSETVLLCEDEASVRTLTHAILASYGYRVLEADTPEKAVEIAGGNEPIHVLVTDVVMPGMGGSELARRIESLRTGVKILYMSGYTDDTIFRHGHLKPGSLFVQKPFTPEMLARKVRSALEG
jgi:CheY-like chemotaxis protein